jgi:glutamyl-Q tRNA(Asp) synthetase
MPAFCKTRIAPTPSGYLHTGNALNFLLTAALAKRYHAKLLLRIDDLDRERYRTAYAEDIFATLRFLNIQWDEGPRGLADFEKAWSQQQRMKPYKEALQKLRAAGAVFACACSRKEAGECRCRSKHFSLDAPNMSWRVITGDEVFLVKSLDGQATTASLPHEMKNFVVRKKDGWPAYQLASVVDDLHFGIDFIVRGEDLWPSTLAQLYLAKQLGEEGFSTMRFYHHPLLKGAGGKKLSKSAGAASVKHWRESGKTKEALLAYIGELLRAPINNATDITKAFGI